MCVEFERRPCRRQLLAIALTWSLVIATGGCGGHDSNKKLFEEARGPSSSCTVSVAPGSGPGPLSGDIDFDVTLSSLAPVTMSFSWSTDGGSTFSLAMPSLDSPLANPASGVASAPGLAFVWDSEADLSGTPPVETLFRLQASPAGTCQTTVLVTNAHEPDCALDPPPSNPAGARPVLTLLPVDEEDDLSRVTLGFSRDGGTTHEPATILATSSGNLGSFVPTDPDNPFSGGAGGNQVVDLPSGDAAMLTWDAAADGVGLAAREEIVLVAWIEDGTTSGAGPFSTCDTATTVLSNAAPQCSILAPTGGLLVGPVSVDLTVGDADDSMVTLAFDYSTDGGASFQACTAAPGSPLPSPAMVAPGAAIFVWDADFDLGSAASVAVRLRALASDGVDLGQTRPAICESTFAWGMSVVETLLELRAVTTLGSRGSPVAGPATPGNPRGNYGSLDDREFDTGTSLTIGDSPVLLFAVGASVRPVIEGLMAIAGSVELSDPINAFGATTYLSDDPAIVDVGADGMLTAQTGNACTLITASFFPDAVAVPGGAPTSVQYAACCDLSGVDRATRESATGLAVGEIDADLPGLPSGPPAPAAGGALALILHVSTGSAALAAHSVSVDYDDSILQIDSGAAGSVQGVSGSTTSYGGPTAVNDTVAGSISFNHFYLGTPVSGVLDFSTVHLTINSAGLASITSIVNSLGDSTASSIGAPGPRVGPAASGLVVFP